MITTVPLAAIMSKIFNELQDFLILPRTISSLVQYCTNTLRGIFVCVPESDRLRAVQLIATNCSKNVQLVTSIAGATCTTDMLAASTAKTKDTRCVTAFDDCQSINQSPTPKLS